MANGKKRDEDWTSWALIIFLFILGIWPVALLLLFAKLFGKDEKRTAPPPGSPSPAPPPGPPPARRGDAPKR